MPTPPAPPSPPTPLLYRLLALVISIAFMHLFLFSASIVSLPPPPFSCMYISELNFRSAPPLPRPHTRVFYYEITTVATAFFTLLKFVFTDLSVFFRAVSPGFFFVGDAELLKLLMISESVSARFNRSPDAFLSHR